MRNKNVKINRYLPYAFLFFLAPFAVSSAFEDIFKIASTSVLLLFLVFTYSAYFLLVERKISLTEFEKKIIYLFIVPIVFSIITAVITSISIADVQYNEYLYRDFPRRLGLIIFNVTIFTTLLSATTDWEWFKVEKIVRFYYYGLLILTLIGFWQFLHLTFDIPFFSLDTRTHIHGTQQSNFIFNWRLTSLANEPSYFAPLLLDFAILSIVFTKKNYVAFALALFLLIFSYSGGGYLNLFLLIIVTPVLLQIYNRSIFNKNTLKFYWIVFIIIGVFIFYNYRLIYDLLYPVIGRLGTVFNITKHGRMYMFVMPFIWVFDGTFINILFGYGPSSYKYLSKLKKLPSGGPVHVTSNNYFADSVFELGYFGLGCHISIFIMLIIHSIKYLKNNIKYLYSALLTVHLISTSLYRADFMQARFWIILFIIVKLINTADSEGGNTTKVYVSQ